MNNDKCGKSCGIGNNETSVRDRVEYMSHGPLGGARTYILSHLSPRGTVSALSQIAVGWAQYMFMCRLQFVLLATFTVSGCASPTRVAERHSQPVQLVSYEEEAPKTVYVVGHGWHTGLVLRSSDVSPEILPEIRDFSNSEFIELGWGDEGFYRAKKITAQLVLRAAFWPTPSVLHVASFRGSVKRFYRVSDIIEVNLSDDQFDDMCRFVSDTFDRTENGESTPLGPGIYGKSTFYRAKGKYYAPKTCNVWTAKALKEAGCPVIPQIAATAENVLSQSRKFGTVIQESPRGLKKTALTGT